MREAEKINANGILTIPAVFDWVTGETFPLRVCRCLSLRVCVFGLKLTVALNTFETVIR